MDIKTDIENDLLNLFLVKDEIRKVKHEFLKNKWLNL
jgi:hypothetical protein